MDVTRHEFEDLVGAFALDAIEPDEAIGMEAFLAGHPELEREVERLRAAAAWIGAAGALQPPVDVRARLLASARFEPASPLDAYLTETERLGDLVASLSDPEFDLRTHNGLTIRELVAHVAAIDAAFADEMVRPTRPYIGADEVAEITARAAPEIVGFSRHQVEALWRDRRDALAAVARTVPAEQHAAGYTASDVLVIRAFEAWTHADDIGAAVGRRLPAPSAPVVRTMTELAMRSMPLALAVTDRAHRGRTARFVLTGPGGGEWLVPCAPGDTAGPTADVEIRVSAVDWCRRFADRMARDELAYEVAGDAGLARDLVDAAPAFAGL